MLAATYLNKKDSLRTLTDDQFEEMVPRLAQELEDTGFIHHLFSQDEMKKDWLSLCKKETLDHETETESEIKPVHVHIVVPATCVVGMKPIRQLMPHFYSVQNYKKISVLSLWKKKHLEKALRFNRKYHSTPYVSEIIRSLSFTNGLGKITIYRPLMAKTIVNYFNAKKVLDVCTGWGGRMLGALSANPGVQYTGIEPCMKTFQGLCNIRDTLSLTNRVTLIHDTAENALTEMTCDMNFDLAITSPPYYNLEIYSDEANQSLNYGDYKMWLEKFLEPIIRETLKRVKYSCWSVKNFKTDKKYNLLTDVIAIHEKYGWKMLDVTFSMTNSKRPGSSTGDTNKSSEETTYCFTPLVI